MPRKSPEDRLQDIDKQLDQLKARRQKLKAQVSQKERKERTRQLIQVGGVLAKWWDVQTPEEAEVVIRLLEENGLKPEEVRNVIRKSRGTRITATPPAEG